jgi:hypothetical protein
MMNLMNQLFACLRSQRSRNGELGSAHVDMLFNMMLVMTIFFTIVSTIQLTLADVSARNGNRLALQSFQVVYDRRAFPQGLQGAEAQTPATRAQDPNIKEAVADAQQAAALTGGTVFASGIVGAGGGLKGIGSYDYHTALFNRGATAGCAAGQLPAHVQFLDGNLIRTTITSEYPWRFGPFAMCLTNTGLGLGRSN